MTYPDQFGGVVPPICTPFTEDGEVDAPSLETLLRYQIDGGVTGIFALGTTSETGALSDAQRTTVIETTVGTVAGQVPVIVGAIGMSTPSVIAYAKQAEESGADAVVSLGPFYHKYSDAEILVHFREVAKAIDIPVIAYNLPQMVQTNLSPEVVIQLASEGAIAGVKDSSGNEPALRAMIAGTNDGSGFSVFTGAELTVDYALFAGAAGVVPGLGNVDPAGYRKMYDASQRQDWDAARQEQARLTGLYDVCLQPVDPEIGITSRIIGGYKTALRELGVIASNHMATPMTPLSEETAGQIRDVLSAAGLNPR